MKTLTAFVAASLLASAAQAGAPANEVVFDRNKGGFYAIYGRALKDNPSLKGEVVIEMDIAASGEVTDCRVVTSELPRDIATKFCDRARQIEFGTQPSPSTFRKRLDFFPSA
jgi:hypothetical protein